MAKQMKRRAAAPSQHRYPREARLNQSLRQVIAEELVALDDEHLDLVTITSIDVDPEMNRAIVFFDSLRGEDADVEILEALARHRVRLQSSVARQIRSKKTPILEFRPDEARYRCLRHRVSDPTGRRHYYCGRRPPYCCPRA